MTSVPEGKRTQPAATQASVPQQPLPGQPLFPVAASPSLFPCLAPSLPSLSPTSPLSGVSWSCVFAVDCGVRPKSVEHHHWGGNLNNPLRPSGAQPHTWWAVWGQVTLKVEEHLLPVGDPLVRY